MLPGLCSLVMFFFQQRKCDVPVPLRSDRRSVWVTGRTKHRTGFKSGVPCVVRFNMLKHLLKAGERSLFWLNEEKKTMTQRQISVNFF